MQILETPAWRRLITPFAILLSAAALGACGDDTTSASGEGGGSASTSNERDTARTRLTQCLRDQGLDVPDDIGQGATPPSDLDDDALQAALDGPCAKLRDQAFGDASESARPEAQEKLDKYAQCMRDAGFDYPDVELGNGPPTALHELDTTDPDFQAADKKCADLRVSPGDVMGGG